jgi:serine phosphatase RsbU (regulator of sigma subunit)
VQKIKALTLFSFLILGYLLPGQNVYTLTPTDKPAQIGNRFLYLRDATAKMTLEEVLKSDKFVPNTDDVPNYDVTTDALWAEVKFTCTEVNEWYLTMDPSALTKVSFYQKCGKQEWKQKDVGTGLPYGNQPFLGHIGVKLDLKPGDTTMLLFSVCDYEPLQFDVKVGSLKSFVDPFHNTDVYYGLCFGVMLMMLIYNLYLYGIQKHRIYLYYVLYVFFNSIFLAVFVGYFFHLPSCLRSLTLWDPVIFPVGFGTFLLLFTRDLFKGLLSKRHLLFVYIYMGIVIADALLGAIGFKFLSFDLIRPLGLILGMVCISMGIAGLRKGSSAAKFYLIGFGSYLGGLTFLILSGHLIPANSVAIMALITGSMIETVFLSFAQADKLKVFEREKEKAQLEVIEQVKENEKLVREQNAMLEQKVKERTSELAEKNKEILDSIHYAERIQSTLLAHESLLQANMPDHFILFKPKDIVSGDFYWATRKDERFYLAVCDSTGHGVPGAFMSLLNISFLNEAITERGIEKPNEVFNYVRNHLINSISRDGGRDGMDGILINLAPTPSGAVMTYVAANNDILLVRGNELIELSADKMPVGQGEILKSFSQHEIQLQKGDMLYLFTDGYADQFGGPKGKKFKYKQLLESLVELSTKPLQEQRKIMDETFENWKGNLEQVDDVLGIGIRI